MMHSSLIAVPDLVQNGNTGRKLMSAVAELMTAHVQGLYTSNVSLLSKLSSPSLLA